MGNKWSAYLTTINVGISAFIALYYVILAFTNTEFKDEITIFSFGTWFQTSIITAEWTFLFDSMSILMVLVVLSISFFVHLYSIEYMANDPHVTRFMSYLSLFTFFMLLFVCASNFILMFLGWEGVGLVSYLLISFWTTRPAAILAATKAILINKIGDFFYVFALCLLIKYLHTADFSIIFLLVDYINTIAINFFYWNIKLIDAVCLSFLVAVASKSAQLGLHTWLPDAMEGPTPVSALIHAATMVTAGIYLIIRCNILFDASTITKNVMIVLGSLTTCVAGLIACAQWDIKKIIAYSTCSQLGYMLTISGFSGFHLSFYHLINHAYFKALLFLCAGFIIHFFSGEQDIRKMGSMMHINPFIYSVFLFASLSLAGLPFFSGFYSKDLILLTIFANSTSFIDLFVFWLCIFAAFLTSFYSLRLLYYVFFTQFNGYYTILKRANFNFYPISYVVFVTLLLFSIFSGYLLQDVFSSDSTFFYTSIPFDNNLNNVFIEFIPYWIKILPFALMFLAILIFCIIKINPLQNIYYITVFTTLSNKFYYDAVYNFIVFYVLNFSSYLMYLFDKGLLEKICFTAYGTSKLFSKVIQRSSFGGLANVYEYYYIWFLSTLEIIYIYIFFTLLFDYFI